MLQRIEHSNVLVPGKKLDLQFDVDIAKKPVHVEMHGKLEGMKWKINVILKGDEIPKGFNKDFEFNAFVKDLALEVGIFGAYIRKEITAIDLATLTGHPELNRQGEIIFCVIKRNGSNWSVVRDKDLEVLIET